MNFHNMSNFINQSNYDRGIHYIRESDFENALRSFEKSFISDEPFSEKALLYILTLHRLMGMGDSNAIPLLVEATKRYPLVDKWHSTLAERYMLNGDYQNAIRCIEEAILINPDNSTAVLNFACWKSSRIGDGHESKELFENWGKRFMDPITIRSKSIDSHDLRVDRCLKVGYMSGDFKNHSVRYFIEAYFRHHDRDKFQVHAFMTLTGDEITPLFKPLVDHWHDVQGLNDDQLFDLIRELEIDILVDLSGHTKGDRLGVFARRAAPVQVTWFGFMQTLGMKAIDWRLTDYGSSPIGADDFYTEKLYRLKCMVTYTPPLNTEILYESPWKSNGYITMVCLNHSRKISDEALRIWARILNENHNAGLILIDADRGINSSFNNLQSRIEQNGLPIDRVTVTGRMTMAEFMRMAAISDFALDSFPVSGGTTTLHALWMGLPTLTLGSGSGPQQGAAGQIQHSCGVGDAVAVDIDDYIAKARDWIGRPNKIDQLRVRCRLGLMNSDLMNYKDRVLEVEEAYRFMWFNFIKNFHNQDL